MIRFFHAKAQPTDHECPGRLLTNAELEQVSGGGVLVIGNQDEPGDQSHHSATATIDNPHAKRIFVVTHNWEGFPNGPVGTLPR
jgi:hypothetical protein